MYFNRGICSRIMAKVFKNRKERKKKKFSIINLPYFDIILPRITIGLN